MGAACAVLEGTKIRLSRDGGVRRFTVDRCAWKSRLVAGVLGLVAVLAIALPASAQVQRSFINTGFEQPDIGNTACFRILSETYVSGWTTSHSIQAPGGNCTVSFPGNGRSIEIWANSFGGVTSAEGTQHVELNAYEASRLSQSVCLVSGETVGWSFAHRARSATETAEILIGSQTIARVSSATNGTGSVVFATLGTATRTALSNNWNRFEGSFAYTGATGTSNIGFSAIGGTASGNFLDDARATVVPFAELGAAAYSTLEGDTVGLPQVRILGTVTTPLAVEITVTGGTATLGSDYTTPTGTANFTVTIPAGNYGTGQLFPLGFASVVDAVTPEVPETIEFTVNQPAAAGYLVQSTANCGGTPISSSTWTIRDNSPALSLVKTATRVDNGDGVPSQGDTISYRFSVTNSGSVALTNVTLQDTLPGLALSGGPIANLAVGATDTTTFTGSYAVAAADMTAGGVTNNARASATAPSGTIQSDISTVFVPLAQSPAITLDKTAVHNDGNRGFASVGDVVTYTFVVTNTGNVGLTNVTLSDPSLSGTVAGTPIASLPAGGTRTLTATRTLTQAHINAGQLVNTATISGSPPTGPPVSATDTATTRLVQAGSMTLAKSAGTPSGTTAGSTIAYNFRMANTGNVPLSSITVNDQQVTALNCPATTLNPGTNFTCTANHVITQAEVDAGRVANTAQAVGTTPSGASVTSSPSSTSTTLPRNPSFTINKTASAATVSAPGANQLHSDSDEYRQCLVDRHRSDRHRTRRRGTALDRAGQRHRHARSDRPG